MIVKNRLLGPIPKQMYSSALQEGARSLYVLNEHPGSRNAGYEIKNLHCKTGVSQPQLYAGTTCGLLRLLLKDSDFIRLRFSPSSASL